MKQVLIRQGRAVVEEVPVPQLEPGTVLVRVQYSCISSGTEISGIRRSGIPLWKRALERPANLTRLFKMATSEGVANTYRLMESKLSATTPIGYSAAGIVQEIGEGVDDLRPGDRVACAGSQCAHHAEIIRVPCNLTVPVPGNLDLALASTVTLGAIALQGVRRAQPSLGETFVVIGLGMIGQLTVQLLKANGCRVIGTDLDRTRIAMAAELGMYVGLHPDDGNEIEQVARMTDGIGADGVIIAAATPDNSVAATAFQLCRKKGRVVLVGDVGLSLNRADFYEKELDFFISASYGPGRYDRTYEEKGLDYPVAYVRWTENRNMSEYLKLVAEHRVLVAPMVSSTVPIGHAPSAYEAFDNVEQKPLAVVLSYPQDESATTGLSTIQNPKAKPASSTRIRIAVVGAGAFSKSMHLPTLNALADWYHIQAIASRTGPNALAIAKQYGANYATTDYSQVLNDHDVDAVLIATRHQMHAKMVLEALQAGKHVFVEKPLALTEAELDQIKQFFAATRVGSDAPVLMTGFNRRFSCYAKKMHDVACHRTNPMILNYQMNAGHIPSGHWVHTEEGGGRNRGEACHIYDLLTYLTDSTVASVEARAIRPATAYYSSSDNFVATLTFADGSVATLTYTALGSREHPKEQCAVYMDGKVLVLEDYRRLSIAGGTDKGLDTRLPAKGHREALEAFACTLRQGGEWPIPLWQQVQASEIAIRVEHQLRGTH